MAKSENKVCPNIDEMTTEELRKTLLKKRKCNARAQQIVELFTENIIAEELFLKLIPEINQTHLEDVFQERALLYLCGYPICCNKLDSQNIPKQKYRISTKTNKVYDISVIKNFCSYNCYKAAVYIKSQMFTSPLWFREQEDIPEFKLLKMNTKESLENVVDISFNKKIKNTAFSSIFDFAEASLHEISPTSSSDKDCKSQKVNEKFDPIPSKVDNGFTDNKIKSDTKVKSCVKPSTSKHIGEMIDHKESARENNSNRNETQSNTKKESRSKLTMMDVLTKVKQHMNEWITIETLVYIYGLERVKEVVSNKKQNIEEYLEKIESRNEIPHFKSQYEEICDKLTLLEFQNKPFDEIKNEKTLNPLPDYSLLKKDGTKLELEIKEFHSNSTGILLSEDEAKTVDYKRDVGYTTRLHSAEELAQKSLRRQIVMDHLNKILEDIFISLGLPLSTKPDLKNLVFSFNLKAHNITFNPIQWYLVGLVIIELLSLKEDKLAKFLQQAKVKEIHKLLISKFQQNENFFSTLVQGFLDIERF